MRKFKTADKNRTNYNYYTAEGKKITITPEEVGSDLITLLHQEDDKAFDAERRENYHIPLHYEDYLDDAEDKNIYLADISSDPLECLVKSIDEYEHEDKLLKLKAIIKTLQPQQIMLIQKVFYEKCAIVEIAREEGVGESAIRSRLNKIYKNLRKKL